MIQLNVDEKCQGHGRCYSLFPSLFEPDDEGFSKPILDKIDDDQRALAEKAVECCPEQAISITEL